MKKQPGQAVGSEIIKGLCDASIYSHPVENIELVETHISWVVLTGTYAYKIKKPVNFGFLDFSSLEKRRFCCEEEVRLNRRLAPALYLGVLAITGSEKQPGFSAEGEVIEYAVKMRQFDQQAQLDNMLDTQALNFAEIEAVASMVAAFHQSIHIADASSDYGTTKAVYHPVNENFVQIRQHIKNDEYLQSLQLLEHWSRSTFDTIKPVLTERKQAGFVRECHGDMHLRNLVWYRGAPLAFDCLEFNPAFRFIDVISDIAFLVMDLQHRQQSGFASVFLNKYLELSGDYAGVRMLAFYCAYRALVRAKVAALRLSQADLSQIDAVESVAEFESYLELALTYTKPAEAKLIITRGLSASGKSTLSKALLSRMPAIRIRSDIERKRLFRNDQKQRLDTADANTVGQGMYSSMATAETYQRLYELGAEVLDAGYTVIIDAACLKQQQWQLFYQLAELKKVDCVLLDLSATAETLRHRIVARQVGASDANLDVLEHQLGYWQPVSRSHDVAEPMRLISVDAEQPFKVDQLIEQIQSTPQKAKPSLVGSDHIFS